MILTKGKYMSENEFMGYDDLVEFISEFIMVYEAARITPHIYIQWYNNLSDEQKCFLMDVRAKQYELTLKIATLEEEAKRYEQSILDEVNKLIKGK